MESLQAEYTEQQGRKQSTEEIYRRNAMANAGSKPLQAGSHTFPSIWSFLLAVLSPGGIITAIATLVLVISGVTLTVAWKASPRVSTEHETLDPKSTPEPVPDTRNKPLPGEPKVDPEAG